MIAKVFTAILWAWTGMLAAAPAAAATADGGLLENAVAANVDPYVGVPSGTVTYSATATVMVCTPTISLYKRASMTVVGAGGTLEFCIEIRNMSNCASAFNLHLSDRLPPDLSYVSLSKRYWVDGASAIVDWVWIDSPGIWLGPYQTPSPTMVNPLMAWDIDMVAMGGTGYICYKATVR